MDKVGLRAQFEAAPGTVGEQGGEVETLRGELIFKGRENLYSRDPLKRRSDAHSVHRLQASLHSRGRPSAPCKADLYYRGALKRHSEAHPMAFVGYVWMPSCQMPSCQIESMGEFIGHCHILRINTWILSPPLKLTSRQ